MTQVFADTSFWIAVMDPRDQWHARAAEAREDLGEVILVTTDEVLAEFMTMFCDKGEQLRRMASQLVRRLMDTQSVTVFPQTRQSFLDGMKLYESRPDKSYSLADCISMALMKREGIQQVLTVDHHFAQEGFSSLMK
jgi:predicted nucleic acid-binding protein